MTKAETRLSKKIRENLKQDYGINLHKNWGGVFTETGAADLYGTLPGGRAVYLELKTPETIKKRDSRSIYQNAWLTRERRMGALAVTVSSYDDVRFILAANHIYPHGQNK